jgi:hypothetical protein
MHSFLIPLFRVNREEDTEDDSENDNNDDNRADTEDDGEQRDDADEEEVEGNGDDDEEEEEEEEGEEEDTEEFDNRMAELKELSRVELKKVLKTADPEFKVLKKHSDEELVDAILDVEFPVEDDEEPPF